MLDELLDQVLEETRRLSEEGPQAGYEAFVRLTDLRERMMEVLADQQLQLTEKQKAMLRCLLELDPVILRHMETLKRQAEEGLRRIRQSGKQRNAYQPQYDVGSIMFDHRR
jgi:hypothetical protein